LTSAIPYSPALWPETNPVHAVDKESRTPHRYEAVIAAGQALRLAADPWVGFFALVLTAWVLVFAAAAGVAGHARAASLGPGMAWVAALSHARSVQAPLQAAAAHGGVVATVAMRSMMCVAMMAPVAVPMLRAYRHVVQGSAGRVAWSGFWTLVAGYVAVWALFSAGAGAAQHALTGAGFVDAAGLSAAPWLTAGLLAVAGVYQCSGRKRACLSRGRSPIAFFLSHWRAGVSGARGMGLRHGAICIGCCWALMALAFVGGSAEIYAIDWAGDWAGDWAVP
jgi:predicted metal-binding membrane protein